MNKEINWQYVDFHGRNPIESITVGQDTIYFEITDDMTYYEALDDLYWMTTGDYDKREDYYDSCLDNDSLALHNFS